MTGNTHQRIKEMLDGLAGSRDEVLPSAWWRQVNQRNIEQLEKQGYDNFKQTIALNYFTWVFMKNRPVSKYSIRRVPLVKMFLFLKMMSRDSQIRYLFKNLPLKSFVTILARVFFHPKKHDYLSWSQSLAYNLLTYLVWEYAMLNIPDSLSKLAEPSEGNPPRLYVGHKLISQDLANSALEYRSVIDIIPNISQCKTIMELGAGYGRTAFIFLKLMPDVRYIFVDIPPALYVAEQYISSQFSERKTFHFRNFNKFSDVEEEFNSSSIVFLLPNQLELLPPKIIDIFINISSLDEMRLDQINYYFDQIERLTKKYFYFKQWKRSKNMHENMSVTKKDYPVRTSWSQIYWRECQIQTLFFEALFDVSR